MNHLCVSFICIIACNSINIITTSFKSNLINRKNSCTFVIINCNPRRNVFKLSSACRVVQYTKVSKSLLFAGFVPSLSANVTPNKGLVCTTTQSSCILCGLRAIAATSKDMQAKVTHVVLEDDPEF